MKEVSWKVYEKQKIGNLLFIVNINDIILF